MLARLHASPLGYEAFTAVDLDRFQGDLRACLVAGAAGSRAASPLKDTIQALVGAPVDPAAINGLMDLLGLCLAELDIADDAVRAFSERFAVTDADPADSPVTPAAPSTPEPQPRLDKSDGETSGPAQTIRVSVDALEHLMTVASELVLIRNQLIQVLRLDPESPFAAPLNRLNQVTTELQEGVMTTRMQPISGAWAKLPRLVRDLAQDLGKGIELSMHGQETELDRQVLELIKDPLTHMIRNAADHGIETPHDRRLAGKSEAGRITLQARHEGGAIVIEVMDDGRGLSPSRLRAKAVAAGVITPGQAEAMSDSEAGHLIFRPGFSTATEITAISGRGVGMDVVRTNIERIGGAIEMTSTEGVGTRFTIRIPLTLTIVSALIVESCGERFAMPQSCVIELVSASDGSGRVIEHVNDTAVLRLRDRLLPLVSLGALLGLPATADVTSDSCIVVARVGSFTFGVIVDRVFDTEEIVVKPVATVLRHLKIYSGATILGDGSVIMILDFKGMSLEAGAPQMVGGADAVELETASAAEQTQPLLVFRASTAALKAAPLCKVARIEELQPASIEWVDGRSVIQYRGSLMQIICADGRPAALDGDAIRPLLVFSRGERNLGLLVDEIVDIVEGPVDPQNSDSLVVAGRATELIDVDLFWRMAAPDADTPAPSPAPQVATPPPAALTKRLLVVDQSPFTQLLLGPLLAQAGYAVEVATDPQRALALHDDGAVYDLILADTTPASPHARQMAQVFGKASAWHATPLLGLGAHRLDNPTGLADFARSGGGEDILAAVSQTLEPLKGAA
jgi:two-component system chemotaxis sensor kinase CheA